MDAVQACAFGELILGKSFRFADFLYALTDHLLDVLQFLSLWRMLLRDTLLKSNVVSQSMYFR